MKLKPKQTKLGLRRIVKNDEKPFLVLFKTSENKLYSQTDLSQFSGWEFAAKSTKNSSDKFVGKKSNGR